MKLLRVGDKGSEQPALIDPEGHLRDLSAHIPDLNPEWLSCASLTRLRALSPRELPAIEGNPRIGPCVGKVGKIVCVGLNYTDHAEESGMPIPTEPILFLKPSSAIVGPCDEIEIPLGSNKTDWEVELGVVIGTHCKYVEETRSMEHIAGYCVLNDLSERSFQLERGGQWDKGKGCDTFAPIGPWMVTADEICNPQDLDMWLEVDGELQQKGNTSRMIFSIARLVSYISHFMSLHPGDVIATGTPAGVALGRNPPRFLKHGQTIRLGIEGLGVQQQRTVGAENS